VATENGATHDLGKLSGSKPQYRDINLNIPVKFPGRETKFICEVQLTLSTIAILKKSEQKIYSLLRMENPAELYEQYVFSRKIEGDESTNRTSHFAMSTDSDATVMPQDYAITLSAVGLNIDTPQTAPSGEIDDEHRGPVQILPEVPILQSISDPIWATASAGEAVPEKGAFQGESGTDSALVGFRRSGTDIALVPMGRASVTTCVSPRLSQPDDEPLSPPQIGADLEDFRCTELEDAGVGAQMTLETIQAQAPAETGFTQGVLSCASNPCAPPSCSRASAAISL
jgi:hypothetical protein